MTSPAAIIVLALLAAVLIIGAFVWLLIEIGDGFEPLVAAIAAAGVVVIMLVLVNLFTGVLHAVSATQAFST